jgi:large subunit ribosomal protein L11
MSARNETPHKIIQSLGKEKCNGSWEEAAENLTMEQVKKLAEDQKDRLTGATLYERCREVMGTCVSMRVNVEGMSPKDALSAMSKGDFAEHFA